MIYVNKEERHRTRWRDADREMHMLDKERERGEIERKRVEEIERERKRESKLERGRDREYVLDSEKTIRCD